MTMDNIWMWLAIGLAVYAKIITVICVAISKRLPRE